MVTASRSDAGQEYAGRCDVSLFGVTDADLDTIEKFAFWDDVAGAESGSFVLDGVAQGAQQEIVVDAADLASLQFQAGDSPSGWDYLYVRAFDGTSWSDWTGVGVTPRTPPRW